MKRQLLPSLLLLALLAGAQALFAQQHDDSKTPQAMPEKAQVTPRLIIGVTGGATIPVGNFAKSDYNNPASGFAGVGGNADVTATYSVSRHWGIAELFSYHQFSYATGNIGTAAVSYPGGFGADSVSWKVKGDNHTFNFLIGPVYKQAFGKKLSVNVRALFGFVDASLAGNNVALTDVHVTQQPFYQAVSRADAFGGQAGINAMYAVAKRVGICIGADYFYSKPDFTVNNVNRATSAGREIFSYNQPIEGINANVSLYYLIDRNL